MVGLLWSNWSFFILFTIIHFGCWTEYQKLLRLIDKDYTLVTTFHKYGVMLAGWCLMIYFTNDSYNLGSLSLHSLGWWLGLIFIFLLPIIELLFSKEVILKNIGYSFLGLTYISLSWSLMIDLRNSDFLTSAVSDSKALSWPWILPLVIVLSIWANDTMAYLVGSWIGKTPFSKISPKKTWEGTIGGALLCIMLVTLVFHQILYWKHLLVISSVTAVIGTMGDLLESKLKRMANVKDSGHIMPGHGGFLDRFDSLIVATPFIWVYVRFFMMQ
jgi:phosphatidate cytidylyltransferase